MNNYSQYLSTSNKLILKISQAIVINNFTKNMNKKL